MVEVSSVRRGRLIVFCEDALEHDDPVGFGGIARVIAVSGCGRRVDTGMIMIVPVVVIVIMLMLMLMLMVVITVVAVEAAHLSHLFEFQ
ncbi:hypothetical protein MAGR_61980 [Mycolicibacterium agri]|uniref:Uncharacterized protein n=1 Tax=Mycolicibacterium agri TaxID=36811 RepID=A0A7I9WBW8_MYCAG|nr:hypothetical protein MAGR_61980 [Mycolicibacterium agri]